METVALDPSALPAAIGAGWRWSGATWVSAACPPTNPSCARPRTGSSLPVAEQPATSTIPVVFTAVTDPVVVPDAVAAVLLDGLSYRRAARMVAISKTEVGDSLDLLLDELAALGFCQPDGTFIEGRATRCMDRFAVRKDPAGVLVDLARLHRQDTDPQGWTAAVVKL